MITKKQLINCHNHPNSLDTGSQLEQFIKREAELGSTHACVTDHGSLGATMEWIKACKKYSLKPIIGLEAYVRDDNCAILKGAGIENIKEYNKYYHQTMHFQDEAAYKAAVRLISERDTNAEQHGSERKQIFTWNDLENLNQFNVTSASGCLIGIVGRHLLSDRPDLATAYYEKARGIAKPGNFYVEVFPHDCSKNYVNGVIFKTADGKSFKHRKDKKLRTNHHEEITAEELYLWSNKYGAFKLTGIKNYRKWEDVDINIVSVDSISDFVQNDCTPNAPDGDVQKYANKFVIELAKKYGDKILVSLDSHLAVPEHKVVQDIKLFNMSGSSWKFASSYHIKSNQECYDFFKATLGTTEKEFDGWVENSYEWASKFNNFKIEKKNYLPGNFYPSDTLNYVYELINKHGRMDWNDPVKKARVEKELDLVHRNGSIDLLPYFFVVEEVCDLYTKNKMLMGAGRGSAASLYLSYLLGITHVDALKYNLPMERFLTEDRIRSGKMPDIDLDHSDRSLLLGDETHPGWLKKRFGDNACAISTQLTLKLKSSIKDVFREQYGHVPTEIELFTKDLPDEPVGISSYKFVFGYEDDDGNEVPGLIETNKDLKQFSLKYSNLWEKIVLCLGKVKGYSKHASAYCIASEPIQNIIPTFTVTDTRCTQYGMTGVEEAGVLKFDFLGLNSAKDIQNCIKLVQDREGYNGADIILDGKKVPGFRVVPFQGKLYDIWDLPKERAVFKGICAGMTETVFQFNTSSAKRWLKAFDYNKVNSNDKLIDSIYEMAVFTALDRPGPLDALIQGDDGKEYNMLEEYARRARGIQNSAAEPALEKLLPETFGVIVFQEQLQRVFKDLGNVTGAEANQFREDAAKKRLEKVLAAKAIFMPGATKVVGAEAAEAIWDQMVTFAKYSFNLAHSACYSVNAYACAFLKHFYPTEWWCAVLQNADKKEIAEEFWRYCSNIVEMPDINLSGANFEIHEGKIRAPLSFLTGVGEKAHDELVAGRPYKDIQDFCEKINNTKVANSKMGPNGKPRVGNSALNSGVVTKLIVSGVMDSLFSKGDDLYTKLQKYAQAIAVATGKRKTGEVDEQYLNMNPLKLYQLRKQILAVYSQDLLPKVPAFGIPEVKTVPVTRKNGEKIDTYRFIKPKGNGYDDYLYVKPSGLRAIDTNDLYPLPCRLALVGYVMDERRFTYQGNKHAIALTIESNGDILEFVKWGNHKTGKVDNFILNADKIPPQLKGSIVSVLLSKWTVGKKFNVENITIVEPPIVKDKK